ncbi:L-2-hydroxyglutarate dehydrogenase, mitochondrial [Zea mays]|uniref:L-2-hydroxyglutarate dehydrogenase, mitochondrial n=1 Tax=Zea mays TaxID=4577 RepID=A0A3L6FU23_MAIZE|nr:L-2-hydroxyglutarate dehydrogenase, mitochondrial [Zea mays]
MLYKYCEERGVAHKRISKLIVATGAAEVPKLNMLLRNAKENGVDDLQLMEGSKAMEMEPELRCLKALLSPSTGIIDSHSLMLSLLADAENLGTTISYNTSVTSGHVGSNGLELHVCESKELQNYHDGGIGVHVTLDLNGLVRFGPDVEWISDGGKDHVSCFLNKFDYSVNLNRCSVFYPVVRKYFPNLKDGSLEPGYSGIRPKLSGPGQPPSDLPRLTSHGFMLASPQLHASILQPLGERDAIQLRSRRWGCLRAVRVFSLVSNPSLVAPPLDAIAHLHSVLVRWSKQQRLPQLGRPGARKRWPSRRSAMLWVVHLSGFLSVAMVVVVLSPSLQSFPPAEAIRSS